MTAKSTRRVIWTLGLLAVAALAGCAAKANTEQEATSADHYLAGQLYVDQGNLELALEELGRAVEINPKLALAYSRMGGIYKTRGQLEDSARSFEKSTALDPNNFRDLVELGGVYQALERLADATRVYLAATNVQPTDYQAHLELGTLYYRLGNLPGAEQEFEQCTKLDKARPEAFAHLGVVYDDQGRSYDAIRAYRESVDKKLDQPKVMINLATAYLKQGRFVPAVDVLKYARGLDDKDPMIHERLGFCYYRLAKYDLARESYGRAMELNHDNPDTLAGLGAVLMIQSVKSSDPAQAETLRSQAVEYWHRSLELNPNQPKVSALLQKYGPQQQASEVPHP